METIIMTDTDKTNMLSAESLIEKRIELKKIMEEAEESIDRIDEELLLRVKKSGEQRMKIGESTVSICERLSYKEVSLEVAKKYKAVKMVVDTKIIRAFYDAGEKIKGLTKTEYISVR